MNTTGEQAETLCQLKEKTMNVPKAPTLPVMSLRPTRKEGQHAHE
jgi:hypothetical protein